MNSQATVAYAIFKAIDDAIDNAELRVSGDIEDLTEPTIDNGYVSRLTIDGVTFRIRVD